MNTSLLLIGILIAILVTSVMPLLRNNHIAYAHTFSEDENAFFLTQVKQIEAQVSLAQNNFPTNPKLTEQYTDNAINLLNQNDPVVNLTWASQISERNSRVANELTSALNSLKDTSSSTTGADPTNNIKTKVDRINGLLGEAVSSRVPKEIVNNATTQALVLANLANEAYFSYGRALGESQSAMSNMAGMAMSVKEASPSPSMSMGNSTGMSSSMAMNTDSGSNSIKNMTEYQIAQALADKAQEVFNKNLNTTASAPA